MENNPLWIKTDSELGSEEEVDVEFYSSEVQAAGGIRIRFKDTLEYYLGWCSNSYKVFPITPPTTRDKVWKITLDKTAGIRKIIHCNEVEVLNVLLSDDECDDSSWSSYWSGTVNEILFNKRLDSASDYYQLENPNGK